MPAAAVFTRRLATRTMGRIQGVNGTLRSIPRTSPRQAFPMFARYYADKSSLPSHTIINMPALSPTMTSGNIGTWQKQAGDKVAPGDVLVEIETDKAQMDFEFQEEGVIAKILLQSGEKDVGVGSPIAVLVEDAADVEAFKDFSVDDAGGKAAPSAPESKKEDAPPAKSDTPAPPTAKESESTGQQLQTSLSRLEGLEYFASPAAKVIALEKGVPLKSVKGTGPGGRITKADVEKYSGPSGGAVASASTSSGLANEDTPISGMRKSIATRLQNSFQQSPHFYIMSDISVTKLLKLRVALNAGAKDGEYKLSVNDLFVKALSVALKKHPNVNASWLESEGVIRKYGSVDIAVAVATPTGLITPIVKNVESKGLQTISSEIKELAGRARIGKLKPEEYQGGTFTISNMGMNDAVSKFTAIINPPHSGILAVGTVKKVAVPGVEDGAVEWDEQVTISGSFDHRIVDGAVGAEFMKTLKKVVESPFEMLL